MLGQTPRYSRAKQDYSRTRHRCIHPNPPSAFPRRSDVDSERLVTSARCHTSGSSHSNISGVPLLISPFQSTVTLQVRSLNGQSHSLEHQLSVRSVAHGDLVNQLYLALPRPTRRHQQTIIRACGQLLVLRRAGRKRVTSEAG